jgi:hypothetical protein
VRVVRLIHSGGDLALAAQLSLPEWARYSSRGHARLALLRSPSRSFALMRICNPLASNPPSTANDTRGRLAESPLPRRPGPRWPFWSQAIGGHITHRPAENMLQIARAHARHETAGAVVWQAPKIDRGRLPQRFSGTRHSVQRGPASCFARPTASMQSASLPC